MATFWTNPKLDSFPTTFTAKRLAPVAPVLTVVLSLRRQGVPSAERRDNSSATLHQSPPRGVEIRRWPDQWPRRWPQFPLAGTMPALT